MVDDAFSVAEPSPVASGSHSEADSNEDRLLNWMKNVEGEFTSLQLLGCFIDILLDIVEDARQNFASTSLANAILPPVPLPVGPSARSKMSRSNSYSRRDDQPLDCSTNSRFSRALPRRTPANQIFSEDGSFFVNTLDMMSPPTSPSLPDSRNVTADDTARGDWTVEGSFFKGDALPELRVDFVPSTVAALDTPRRRRVTLSVGDAEDLLSGSPSKKRDARYRSQGDLLQRKITPVDALEKALSRRSSSLLLFSGPRLTNLPDLSGSSSIFA